jgi:hypothetical protein
MPIIAVRRDEVGDGVGRAEQVCAGVRGGGGQEVRGAVGVEQVHHEERRRAGDLGVEIGGEERETSVETVMEESRGSSSERRSGECGEERAGPGPGVEGRAGEQDQ